MPQIEVVAKRNEVTADPAELIAAYQAEITRLRSQLDRALEVQGMARCEAGSTVVF